MSTMSQLLNIVDDLRSRVKVPEINDPYLRNIWIVGRNIGVNKVRDAVRHNPNNALPFLKEVPEAIRIQMDKKASDMWLEGYNAAVDYVQVKVNTLIFEATHGQVMTTKM